jgi:choice-of-anchor C domain-containing protein
MLASTLAAMAAGPNLLTNGDFESPVTSQAWIHVANGTSGLPGWTTSGDGVELMHSYWQPAHGQQSVNLSSFGASEVAQQVETTSGASYLISWYISGNPQCTTPTTRVLHVIWNGNTVATPTFDVSGHTFQSMGWTLQSTQVAASGATSTLAFLRAVSTDGSCGVAIDDVALQLVAGTGGPARSGGAGGGSSTQLGPPPRSTITSSLATPGDAFSSLSHVVFSAVIAALAILLITFPAQLFNHTLQENYDDIVAFWERHVPFVRRLRQGVVSRSDQGTHLAVAGVVILAGAVLGGLLDPNFGFNGPSVTTSISMILSTLWGIAVSTSVATTYRRRRRRDVTWSLRALPAGLPIAILCVLVSRLSDFQPGYLYGVVCSAVFVAALAKNEQGHTVALGTLTTITLSLVAWLIWVPVNGAAANSGAPGPLVLIDDFLGALVTGGLIGSTIGMVPLRFLPGGTLAAWHRGAWAFVSFLVTFLFVAILLSPARGGHPGHAALLTIIVLFVLFGGGSVAFAGYFARKKRLLGAAAARG